MISVLLFLLRPAAVSFDDFENFEDRGNKFNHLVKKMNLKNIINVKN